MLTTDQIKQLARQCQTTESNIWREYFQHLYLSAFYQQRTAEKIFFKGGTALHLLYQNPRFSEDLDFSTSAANLPKVETAVINSLAALEKNNVSASILEAKFTSGGYLAQISFARPETTTLIQLEISARRGTKTPEVITVVNDFIPAYLAISLSRSQLVGEKIQALLTRQKPRDFYDLYFILRANLLPPDQKKFLPRVARLLEKTRLSFERELKIFLPRSHWALIRHFPAALEQELKKYL